MRSESARRFDLVNGDDVRSVEQGEGLRLPDEPPPAMLVSESLGGRDLNRDVAAKPRVAGTIDLTHTASAQRRQDFVCAEPGPRCKWHVDGRQFYHPTE